MHTSMLPEAVSISFRLSLWRPARLDRPLLQADSGHRVAQPGQFLEQVYSWNPGSIDMLSSFAGTDVETIRKRLHTNFAPERPVATRTIKQFESIVGELLKDLATGALKSNWTATDHIGDTEGAENRPIYCNAAIVVLRHLWWVARNYSDVPNCTVVIR